MLDEVLQVFNQGLVVIIDLLDDPVDGDAGRVGVESLKAPRIIAGRCSSELIVAVIYRVMSPQCHQIAKAQK